LASRDEHLQGKLVHKIAWANQRNEDEVKIGDCGESSNVLGVNEAHFLERRHVFLMELISRSDSTSAEPPSRFSSGI
jgi:thymidine kinase